jgi:hypothetical protein
MNGSTKISLILFISLFSYTSLAQENKYTKRNKSAPSIQYTTEKCYSRCIYVKDSIVYTANSNGALYVTNLRTKESINLLSHRKYEELRDIFAIPRSIYAVQSGSNGLIVRTNGQQFLTDYEARDELWRGVFLNSVDIRDSVGFMMGDPKSGIFNLFKSTDAGTTWDHCMGSVAAFEGEKGFAASGTTVQVLNDSTFVFISGGKKSRFFRSNDGGMTWKYTSLPYLTGESSGAFSICMINEQEGVIVGGDYKNPDLCMNTCFYSNDGGEFWINAKVQTRGYRSCVIFKNGIFYACGPNGIDYSIDKGEHWKPFMNGTYMAMCADETKLYATTQNGSFQVFELIDKK